MKLTTRTKLVKQRVSVRVRMDLTADDLASVIAGTYLRSGALPRSIPADAKHITNRVADGLALFGMSVAVDPGSPGYPVEDHEALTTFIEATMGIRRDDDAHPVE